MGKLVQLEDKLTFTISEAAEYFNIPEETINDWIDNNEIKVINFKGKRLIEKISLRKKLDLSNKAKVKSKSTYTIAEAVEHFNISEEIINYWIKNNEIKVVKDSVNILIKKSSLSKKVDQINKEEKLKVKKTKATDKKSKKKIVVEVKPKIPKNFFLIQSTKFYYSPNGDLIENYNEVSKYNYVWVKHKNGTTLYLNPEVIIIDDMYFVRGTELVWEMEIV